MSIFQSIPYKDTKTGLSFKLLVVEPFIRKEGLEKGGLYIPVGVGDDCEEGKVISVCPGSEFKVDDVVIYKKIDRTQKENYETVTIEGVECDIIGENEVWNINERPYKRIFVQPLSDNMEVSGSNLVIPDKAEGVPQKGIVMDAPANSFCKVGDTVEYRKNVHGIYYTVTVDDKICDVLYEPDIFTINGKVSPHRIIVKIDMLRQRQKQSDTEGGLALSPVYLYMLHNLQLGEITEIGSEAKKLYPELNAGDMAIIHHKIEYDAYRLLKKTTNKRNTISYEHRMIDCFDIKSREIFGRLEQKTLDGKVPHDRIVPFNGNVFLNWDIEMFEKNPESQSLFIDFDFNLDKCKNSEELLNGIQQRKTAAFEKYKAKYNGYCADQNRYNGAIKEEKDQIDRIENLKTSLQNDALRTAAYVRKNHLLICSLAYRQMDYIPDKNYNFTKFLVPYAHLYPIDILGKKYLITPPEYIFAIINTYNMPLKISDISPIRDFVIVKPIEDENKSFLIIPEEAKEAPQQGVAIAVGNGINNVPLEVKKGDTIYYRKGIGTQLKVEDQTFLLMKENDIFLRINS